MKPLTLLLLNLAINNDANTAPIELIDRSKPISFDEASYNLLAMIGSCNLTGSANNDTKMLERKIPKIILLLNR